jgi:hypothetical protein
MMQPPCVVNVATTEHYQVGQLRLLASLVRPGIHPSTFTELLAGWPTHKERPYAFKAYALREIANYGYMRLLWADSSIRQRGPLDRIWQHAKEHGVWFSHSGWMNYEWTAQEAYEPLGITIEENKTIQHVSATTFALDLEHPKGWAFLSEYYRLASKTQAFCGPWTGGIGVQHRHDQTAASVIVHRLGIPLTSTPDFFAYAGGETEKTILLADGRY